METRIVEIPLNKLTPSDTNVRKTNRMSGVEELAANIAARGGKLIQSLSVQPVRNENGEETGVYRVPAGGRRLAALKLLAKRKVIAKSALIPCIVSEDDEEELSLSENVMREPLHPADQFDAFKALSDKGKSAEEIGARFGVTAQVVRQRLRLASVTPALIQKYREGELTLDQIIAFAATEDHARQMQVYDLLTPNTSFCTIRRMMTETQVSARDRRAVFIGHQAYGAAGGTITRDLFTDDDGGWFSDPALLDRLVLEKLETLADEIRDRDGWKWAHAGIDYPHTHGLKRLYAKTRDLSEDEQGRLDAASAEYDRLAAEYEGADELPEGISEAFDRLNAEIGALNAQRQVFAAEDIARTGVFVALGYDGAPRIEAGFIRPEDEQPEEPDESPANSDEQRDDDGTTEDERREDPSPKRLSEALIRDLAAHRTMALRFEIGEHPVAALNAVVHALVLQTFYATTTMTCLSLTSRSQGLGAYAPGVEDTVAGRGLAQRHTAWAARLPEPEERLWDFIIGLEAGERLALLAHCASLTVYAIPDTWDRIGRRQLAADTLARAVGLDMAAYWKPTTSSYFGRVTKAQIIEAVSDVVSEEAARRIEDLSKSAMAEAAESLMAECGWLPAPLRTETERQEQAAPHSE